jgi:hypothetical protein
MRSLAVTVLAALVCAATPGWAQDAATTTGTVAGVVRDASTGEALIGVTVVASSAQLQGVQAAISDERGAYRLTGLPPGEYVLTAYYGDAQLARPGVRVQLGQAVTVNLQIGAGGGEVVTIEGRSPIIDQGSS